MDPIISFTGAKSRLVRASQVSLLLAIMSTLLLIVSLALAAPVMASPFAEGSARVRHADLDLGAKAGRAALDRRVGRAARKVCGEDMSMLDLKWRRAVRRCVGATITATAPQIERVVAARQRAGGALFAHHISAGER